MFFKKNGTISFINSKAIIQFDKNGNVMSTNIEEKKVQTITDVQNEIDSKTKEKQNLEQKRDSDDFKHKNISTTINGLKQTYKRPKTADELSESINKINVTSCALAAIQPFNRYIAPIVTKNEISLFFDILLLTKNNVIPSIHDNKHVVK